MSNTSKGRKNERRGAGAYGKAGYKVSTTHHAWYGEQDYLGSFDLMAVCPGRKVRLVQVKTNAASGITKWAELVPLHLPREHVVAEYAVRYDADPKRSLETGGWRLIQLDWEGGYYDAYDEREHRPGVNIGEGLAAFLVEDEP